jgi:hypothetical protein
MYINFLEQQAVLITRIGRCKSTVAWEAFMKNVRTGLL